MGFFNSASVFLAGAAVLVTPAAAQTAKSNVFVPDEPLWELRIGGSALYAPDYPGAEDKSLNGVGAPIFIYRGDRIRFGEYGVARAIATETPRFEFDISADAVYSANSKDDGARAGMPDLDYLLQIGPQAIWNIHDTEWTAEGRTSFKFIMPVRGVASTDFSYIDHAGWIAEPQFQYRRRYPGDLRQSWSATLFWTFGDEDLNAYWYGVTPEFATVERPAYEADAGLVSTGLRLSWTRELNDRFQVFLTYQGRAFSGAANSDSPLLREDVTHAGSISFVWKALQSSRPAQNDDM